jgi:hypothetical protein
VLKKGETVSGSLLTIPSKRAHMMTLEERYKRLRQALEDLVDEKEISNLIGMLQPLAGVSHPDVVKARNAIQALIDTHQEDGAPSPRPAEVQARALLEEAAVLLDKLLKDDSEGGHLLLTVSIENMVQRIRDFNRSN